MSKRATCNKYPPISLSIAGEGQAFLLEWQTIMPLITTFRTANLCWAYLRQRFDRRWLTDHDQPLGAFHRLNTRQSITEAERERLERFWNYLVVHEGVPITPRIDVGTGYIPRKVCGAPRRTLSTIYNGLALELEAISASRLLEQSPGGLLLRRQLPGHFALLVFAGVRVSGPLSQRIVEIRFSTFYERVAVFSLSPTQLNSYSWFKVLEYGATPGFRLVGK